MKIVIHLDPIGYQIDIEDLGVSDCRDYGDNINTVDSAKLIKFLVENLDNSPNPRVILP